MNFLFTDERGKERSGNSDVRQTAGAPFRKGSGLAQRTVSDRLKKRNWKYGWTGFWMRGRLRNSSQEGPVRPEKDINII